MVLEEQIQLFCLNLIKTSLKKIFLLFISIIIIYIIYFFHFKRFNYEENLMIPKGTSFTQISYKILNNENFIEKNLYILYLRIWDKYINKIDYGEFKLYSNINLINITKIISNPSNVFYKFTIVEGWQKYQLEELFEKKFNKRINLDYMDIIAETYFYNSSDSVEKIISLMKNTKNNFFINHKNNFLLKKFSINDILIIASLVEKEGLDFEDKKLISSVIFNRLEKGMKLQIDATTIFSITKGRNKLNKKLKISDLKIVDKYNTYHIYGLPPNPICYVGPKTIEIVLENYKSDYLFYFFNERLKKHIFSITFNEHKDKLQKYRNINEK